MTQLEKLAEREYPSVNYNFNAIPLVYPQERLAFIRGAKLAVEMLEYGRKLTKQQIQKIPRSATSEELFELFLTSKLKGDEKVG